jgi:RND superfamily putative drug exporter
MIAALTLLPALLAVLGPKVNALRVRPRRRAEARLADETSGGWYRLARSVMRRPVVYVAVIVAGLAVLATPFLRVSFGGCDERVLPAGTPSRVVAERIVADFPGNVTQPIEAVLRFPGPATSPSSQAALTSYVTRLGGIDGVTGAHVTGVKGDVARVDLSYTGNPESAAARAIVGEVRATAPPAGAQAYVGGTTAQLTDELSSLGSVLPWMALIVVLATFVLLFLAFGSRCPAGQGDPANVLSLGATFGVVVWIFQYGHLSGLLGFTPTGTIDRPCRF